MNADCVIGFDADDTLWHNEVIFDRVHRRFCELLSDRLDATEVEQTLFATEMRNLALYGYGIKSFTLSSIETAIELTNGEIHSEDIRRLIQSGREMLEHPVELLDAAAEVLRTLAAEHPLMLITKGDLRDQERKLERSGLSACFRFIEIVSEKNTDTYRHVFERHTIAPKHFFMVGNSIKSDILPVLDLGGAGAHIPYPLLWKHEYAESPPADNGRFFPLRSLSEVPAAVRQWREGTTLTAK